MDKEKAYKLLVGIQDLRRIVSDSFWEDDENRLPDLPSGLDDYQLDLFYSLIEELSFTLIYFVNELNKRFTPLYVLRDNGRIAVYFKGESHVMVDGNMLSVLHDLLFSEVFNG